MGVPVPDLFGGKVGFEQAGNRGRNGRCLEAGSSETFIAGSRWFYENTSSSFRASWGAKPAQICEMISWKDPVRRKCSWRPRLEVDLAEGEGLRIDRRLAFKVRIDVDAESAGPEGIDVVRARAGEGLIGHYVLFESCEGATGVSNAGLGGVSLGSD